MSGPTGLFAAFCAARCQSGSSVVTMLSPPSVIAAGAPGACCRAPRTSRSGRRGSAASRSRPGTAASAGSSARRSRPGRAARPSRPRRASADTRRVRSERDHPVEHVVAAQVRGVRVRERVVVGRALDQTGEQRALRERQLRRRLVEVEACGGADPVDVVPEEDVVQIQLEDLVLRVLLLDALGERELLELAGERSVRRPAACASRAAA